MKLACLLALLLGLPALHSQAQQTDTGQPTLTVQSTLVQVPVLVKDKKGKVVFGLQADDFVLTDNGVPQTLVLDPDSDSQPLALAIVVETGGAGVNHLREYQQLDAILDGLIGNVEHQVAVIGFDSTPHLLMPFMPNTDLASQKLENLEAGDPGGAVLDAVAFGVEQLRVLPTKYRRAILLLSETVDQGSRTNLEEALRLISDTNTTMYTFGFSSTHSAVSHEASKFNSAQPGPAHGCFSKEGADVEYKGHYSKQVLDCISQLAPPVRFATMAFLAARSALRTNTAESIAKFTGGEFFRFHNAKDLRNGLISASHDVPNFYVLSFRPTSLNPGMHALHLQIKDRPQLAFKSRSQYWIDGEPAK